MRSASASIPARSARVSFLLVDTWSSTRFPRFFTDGDEGFVSFDVHHLQLVRDRVENGSRVGRLELP